MLSWELLIEAVTRMMLRSNGRMRRMTWQFSAEDVRTSGRLGVAERAAGMANC